MFDFEKLEVYKKAKLFNNAIAIITDNLTIDKTYRDQLRRAAFSIILNIAESTGRFTVPDKRNFFVIARGSVFECVAIVDYLKDRQHIKAQEYYKFYEDLEELSKMFNICVIV